jgi:hypothetical protein
MGTLNNWEGRGLDTREGTHMLLKVFIAKSYEISGRVLLLLAVSPEKKEGPQSIGPSSSHRSLTPPAVGSMNRERSTLHLSVFVLSTAGPHRMPHYLVLRTKSRLIAGVFSTKERIGVRMTCGKASMRLIFEDLRNTGVSRRS